MTETSGSGARCFAGVDVGSANAKCVIIDDGGRVRGSAVKPTGVGLVAAAESVFDESLARAGLKTGDILSLVSTGYGREVVRGKTKAVTEITCHARGACEQFPGTRFVIDIGGQDSKAIAVGPAGAVTGFEMNDKCAAGTGRFLEVMAGTLGVGLENMGKVAIKAERPATISSTCTVFAESEVVSLLAQGVATPSIVAGLCRSVAERVYGLAARVGVRPEVTMTGGVSRNAGVVSAMEQILGTCVNVPAQPLLVGALGAAFAARDDFNRLARETNP